MKIEVKPGTRLELGPRQWVSSRGGIYDIGGLSPEDQKRIVGTKGVSQVKDSKGGDK